MDFATVFARFTERRPAKNEFGNNAKAQKRQDAKISMIFMNVKFFG
jgi:hypothetical protein